MKRWIFRVCIGLAFAAPMFLLSATLAQANPLPLPEAQNQDPTAKCQVCHADFHTTWEGGQHGQAATDPTFRKAWRSQGSPEQCLTCHTTGYDAKTGKYAAEGVTCAACHSPLTENHPQEPMAADRSAQLCGTCHTETFFEWQVSKHREVDLSCVGCHDSHGAALKSEDPSELCASCHRDRASNFAHTAHSQEGLTCADCHLSPTDSELGEGHAIRDHSFNVKLSTCNECHAYQMHDPVQVHADSPTPEPADAMASVETLKVSAVPEPVSPVGFAVLSALIGFAGGIVLAPWIERWYHRMDRDNK
ncbi:MAG TPA: cytochrome c3 family protein [Anaerolineae bacterium]|nr:cytochrome c3 family protein [Anaerolineae bacterium]